MVCTLLALGLGGVLGACKGGGEDGDSCVSTREYFVNEVWPKVLGKTCISCHGPAGVAEEQGAEFRLLPPSYPGFLDANLEAVREHASVSYDGLSALLAKPSGKTKHGGGEVLKADSEEYRLLESLLAQIKEPRECPDADGADLDAVELLSPEETLRKAALHLAGRLPTAEELADVAGSEEALADAVRELLEEDAFYDRLGDIFNDLLLTDRYLIYTGFAVNLLNEQDFPNAGLPWDAILDDAVRYQINRAVAREPIDLINYIVRNDRPFTEILTADYTVFNPFSAALYGVDLKFDDPNDPREFKEGKLFSMRGGVKRTLPHAGVLSSPMFLNRFPTTPTNRNRHRARMTYKLFLATDILRIGERPIDPSLSEAYTNPTRDDKQCNFCHQLIDPVAGAFQNYDDYDQEVLTDREWYPEMFAPGFAGEDMPKSEFPRALEWLAKRIADDPRFVIATVHTVFRALTGVEPLHFPTDTADPLYAARLKAWEAQDALFRKLGEDFVADDYNLKTVIVGVVLSPYFRGVSIDKAELTEEEAAELDGVGVGRLSTPELLANKIHATTGIRWIRGWDLRDWLATDYRILYGGIDSDTVTRRLGTMNGIMSAVAGRMANEVACAVTAYDFSRPVDKRKLFPKVTLDHVPLGPTGAEIPDVIADIKANIVHLHQQLLGETLTEDDPEVERTYNLFLETWKEGVENVAGGSENAWLSWWCQARVDPNTNVDLPEAEKINTDENYVIRSWMAVMSYLLSDYRFLYE
ncbi:MAG TPA: DUF1592 domain-containing protein [Nannocystis sp.]